MFISLCGVVRIVTPVVFGRLRGSARGGVRFSRGWCFSFRFLLPLPLCFLLSLRLLLPPFHPWFPSLSLLVLSLLLTLLFLLLLLLALLGRLLLLLSPLLFPFALPSLLAILLLLLLFPISLLLPSASAPVSLPSLAPPLAPLSASSGAPFLSLLPFVSSASSSSTAVSWSIPPVVTCSAPSLTSLSAPAPSASFPRAPPPPPLFPHGASFHVSSTVPPHSAPRSSLIVDVPSSLFVPSGAAASGSGVLPSDSACNCFPSSGTSYADFVDPCFFRDGDGSSTKGEEDSPALGKSKSSKIFHEVVNLIVGFFPHAK